MKILSVNAGSSSLKFSLFDMETEDVIASGVFERIGRQKGHNDRRRSKRLACAFGS